MTAAVPRRAMVLAAGLGLRMRPLTLTRPKPLVALAGRTLLDRALDALAEAGVERAVVNAHYLGEMIAAHVADRVAGRSRPHVDLSPEAVLLDTGGGVANALPLLGDAPFYVVNADIAWEDGAVPALVRLAAAWRDTMDALLLVQTAVSATGYDGNGDFDRDADGRLCRRKSAPAACVFTGVQMLHPRLFRQAPAGAFSLNLLYDRAEAAGRLSGVVHDAAWYHVGTPAALAEAEALMNARPRRP